MQEGFRPTYTPTFGWVRPYHGATWPPPPGWRQFQEGTLMAETKTRTKAAPKAAKPKPEQASANVAKAVEEITKRVVSRQGAGAEVGETVRVVRRKNEEKGDGVEAWHIWKSDSNRNVVPDRFPSQAAAADYAKKQGWGVQLGRTAAKAEEG